MQHEGASNDPKDQALADLVILAFFFLLRIGERIYYLLGKSQHTEQLKSDAKICNLGASGPLG